MMLMMMSHAQALLATDVNILPGNHKSNSTAFMLIFIKRVCVSKCLSQEPEDSLEGLLMATFCSLYQWETFQFEAQLKESFKDSPPSQRVNIALYNSKAVRRLQSAQGTSSPKEKHFWFRFIPQNIQNIHIIFLSQTVLYQTRHKFFFTLTCKNI